MKKTMKRSLALGALMAFVITGSAMAADRVAVGKGDNKVLEGNVNVSQISAANGGRIEAKTADEIVVDYNGTGDRWAVQAVKNVNEDGLTGSKIVLGGDKTKLISITAVSTSGDNINNEAVGIAAQRESTYKKGEGPYIELNSDKVVINAHSEYGPAMGIVAMNASVPGDDTKPSEVVINAKETVITATTNGADYDYGEHKAIGIQAFSQGKVTINGSLTINAATAIMTRGGAVTNINAKKDKDAVIKLNGDIDFNYENLGPDVAQDKQTTVNINMTNSESHWIGNVTAYGNSNGVDGDFNQDKIKNMNLSMSDGAQWTTDKGKNVINNLELNGGIINVVGDSKDHTITVDKLIGADGTVNVSNADKKVTIADKSATTNLTVGATTEYSKELAKGDIAEGLQQIADQVVDNTTGAGKSAADNVTMAETGVLGETSVQVDDNGKIIVETIKEDVNSSNAGIAQMGSVALMTWRQENNDMNKRLGELRNSKGEHGIWTRMTRGESDFEGIKNQYNAYQIGYDEKLSTDKSWTVGAALTYTEGKSSFAEGTGENTHKRFAVYGSKLNEDGSFIDLIAKYARLDHEFDALGGAGNGEYDTNGYSVSAEYGKRFEQGNGFWVEPQVELTYGKIGSASYKTSEGVTVAQDGMDSLVGRVGLSLGKDIKDGNVYVRASYLYDFDGETSMSFSDGQYTRTMEQDLGGGWFEVGVGTNINLSDATYVYLDVEKTYGGDVATPWQWNAGVRYSF